MLTIFNERDGWHPCDFLLFIADSKVAESLTIYSVINKGNIWIVKPQPRDAFPPKLCNSWTSAITIPPTKMSSSRLFCTLYSKSIDKSPTAVQPAKSKQFKRQVMRISQPATVPQRDWVTWSPAISRIEFHSMPSARKLRGAVPHKVQGDSR